MLHGASSCNPGSPATARAITTGMGTGVADVRSEHGDGWMPEIRRSDSSTRVWFARSVTLEQAVPVHAATGLSLRRTATRVARGRV